MPLVKAMTWILQISLSCKCFCRIYSDEVMIVYWLISLNYCLKTLLPFTAYMTITKYSSFKEKYFTRTDRDWG